MTFKLATAVFLSLCALTQSVAMAQSITVTSSIKPLALLVTSLTEGEINGEYLIDPRLSPHDYALRPSDVRKVRKSDLIIWVSESLEPFLESALEQSDSNNLRLLTLSDMSLIEHDSHDHDSHDDHDDHEQHQEAVQSAHDHDHSIDPHIWLGHSQVKVAAQAIHEQLIALQPELKAHREQQLHRFISRLDSQKLRIEQQLSPIAGKGFFVFHDGYSYFEKSYGLKRLGEFTINPQQQAGAKTISRIRESLAKGETDCIFAEPQFEGAMLQRLAQDTGVEIGILDPLGIDIENDTDGYFNLIDEMAMSFSSCLQ